MRVRLNRPQSKAHRALQTHKTIVLPWGRGVGKSWFMRLCAWLLIAQYDGVPRPGCPERGIRIVLFGPTRKQLVDIHGAKLEEELATQWAFLGGKLNKTLWKIEFPGGSWFQLFGAENANNSRGLRCDVVLGDEFDDIEISDWDGIVLPWLSEPWSLKLRLAGGTPRRGRYGLLYRTHQQAKDPKTRDHVFAIHATYRDAPEQVDQEYVEEVRRTVAKAVFEREWECNYDSAEGLVYPMFSEDFHVRPWPEGLHATEFLIGADHGFEDPGVILISGVIGNGRDAIIHVIDEIYEQHQDPTWWGERVSEVVELYPMAKWYADPSRPDVLKGWRKRGARIQDVDNDIESGVAAVADRLVIRTTEDGRRYSKIYVDPRCVNTIQEMGKYRRKRDPNNADAFLDAIVDKNNHAQDSLRYMVLNRFGRLPNTRRDYDATNFGNG